MWSIGCILYEMMEGEPLFPGDSDIDQLYMIQKTIGPLSHHQKELFSRNPRFMGFSFDGVEKTESFQVDIQDICIYIYILYIYIYIMYIYIYIYI